MVAAFIMKELNAVEGVVWLVRLGNQLPSFYLVLYSWNLFMCFM